MTEKQYNDYTKLKEEIKPLKDFLFWCSNPNSNKFSLVVNSIRKIWFKFSPCHDVKLCELPLELEAEIVKVVEAYVTKKEKELEEI